LKRLQNSLAVEILFVLRSAKSKVIRMASDRNRIFNRLWHDMCIKLFASSDELDGFGGTGSEVCAEDDSKDDFSVRAILDQGGTVILAASNDRDISDENRQTYSH